MLGKPSLVRSCHACAAGLAETATFICGGREDVCLGLHVVRCVRHARLCSCAPSCGEHILNMTASGARHDVSTYTVLDANVGAVVGAVVGAAGLIGSHRF